LNSKKVTVNGVAKTLDVPAASINGRTYVPLRFVGESFGAEVKFDAAKSMVTITTK
jgi:hypothetical protein